MSWIFPLFSSVCSNSSNQKTQLEGASWGVTVSGPLLLQAQSHTTPFTKSSSSVLDMGVYCQKPGSEPHACDGWESNLHFHIIYGFLITICSHASVVTSLGFVLLAGKLALEYLHANVPPCFYFLWLKKPCPFMSSTLTTSSLFHSSPHLWLSQSDLIFPEERLQVYTFVPIIS